MRVKGDREENKSILGLLGLAHRARKARGGSRAVEASIRSGKARLVLLALDTAEGTRKQFLNLTRRYQVPVIQQHSMVEYGDCFQSAPRSVVSINDRHFAAGMLKKTGNTSPPDRVGYVRKG